MKMYLRYRSALEPVSGKPCTMPKLMAKQEQELCPMVNISKLQTETKPDQIILSSLQNVQFNDSITLTSIQKQKHLYCNIDF